MEPEDVAAVVAGFGAAAKVAVEAGCDGVEINAGQHSLVRQFLSGLTNHRGDEWGQDRLVFARQVIEAVRGAIGDRIVGLRLSCDELAPWAGITPDMATGIAAGLASLWSRPARRRSRLDLLRGEDAGRLPRADRVQHRPVS